MIIALILATALNCAMGYVIWKKHIEDD